MALRLTLGGCSSPHRGHGLSISSAQRGRGVAAGLAEMIVKYSSMGFTHVSVLRKVTTDRQHGSARWSRAAGRSAVLSLRGHCTRFHLRGTISKLYYKAVAL